MPRQLRCFDFTEPQYKIWGIVRRCLPIRSISGEKTYVIGIAFIGKSPPPSYFQDPARLYDITHRETEGFWHIAEADVSPRQENLPKEARRQTRFFIPETVTLEAMDNGGSVVATETTVTENISLGGAAVFTSLQARPGSFVRVSSDRYSVKIISVVRGKRIGPDGLPRLHLEFIDHFFPLEGIE